MKINQSRQLNHKQVLSEGERLGSKEAIAKHRKDTHKQEKIRKEKEWEAIHAQTFSSLKATKGNMNDEATTTSSSSTTALKSQKELKALVQMGSESLRSNFKKNERKERNIYSTNDHYNSEGQLRNYERSLKSVDSHTLHTGIGASVSAGGEGSSYNDNDKQEQQAFQRERDGAKRLANELKRRAQKAEKRKQNKMEFEATDVSYINKRNKHFNEKINRAYDKHTAEIRQNLERGTAL
mmetsp:Transcript_4637/g.5337  ORF Transcript_4637/g.5337 Transcript_4637/m.5337 type:complete len:238 (+) Transcript_4637:1022-1735(+)